MKVIPLASQSLSQAGIGIISEYGQSLFEQNLPPATIAKYVSTAQAFYDFIAGQDQRDYSKGIGKVDVLNFLHRNEAIAPQTFNNYLTYLRQLFKWLQSEKSHPDITVGIRPKKVQRKFYKDSLPESVILELYQYFETRVPLAENSTDKRTTKAAALRNLAFFGILISLGSRAGMTCTIKLAHINEKVTKTGNVHAVGIMDKGKATVTYRPIPEFVFKAIDQYLHEIRNYPPSDYLFRSLKTNSQQNRSISYNQMWKVVTAAFVAIGVKNKSTHKNVITPHSLRHSLAEVILEKYGMEYLQKYYNHASITTTQMYAGRGEEQKIFNNPPDIKNIYGL